MTLNRQANPNATPSTTPLSFLSEEQKAEPWTEEREAQFQSLLKSLKADANYAPNKDDEAIITIIINNYKTTGDLSYFKRFTELLNPGLEAVLNTSEQKQDEPRSLDHHNPIDDIIEPQLNPSKTACDSAFQQFVAILEEKITKEKQGAVRIALLFRPNTTEYNVYDAPPSMVLEDAKDAPFKSLATLRLTKFIDAVLTRVDAKAYEAAKQDSGFQERVNELVNVDRESQLGLSLSSIRRAYNGDFRALYFIPHIFHRIHNHIRLRPSLPIEFLPHPALIEEAKLVLKAQKKNGALLQMLSPLVGRLMISEKYPHLKEWTFLPKTVGKDAGFILESPDQKQRLYFKVTDNMINELFCAKVLSRLGLKMAETSIYTNDVGNCFLATCGLNRKYQKNNMIKQKFFQPFSEAFKEPVAYNHDLRPEFYGDKESQLSKMQIFINTLFADEGKLTKQSFAKLLLAGLVLGLSDLGGHGANIGPLISTKGEKITQKIGIVDYQFNPNPVDSLTSLNEVQDALAIFIKQMVPLCQALFEKLTPDDIKYSLTQLLSPRRYASNAEGYFLTEGSERQPFENAIEMAYNDTFAELQKTGLMKTLTDIELNMLSEAKTIILVNLKTLANCLEAETPQPTNHNNRPTL